MADVLQTIKGILEGDVLVDVAPGRMTLEDSLRDVYGLDSLGFVELRVRCEEVFGITITEDEFSPEHFSTLGGVVELVERLIEAHRGAVPEGA
ncbi:acyl carrier protein [Streptacidiphilus sp. PB12-B1b]|uniref:acyl carrier protein n=1 Tax=Streptacidiphilus sp. PB12-B1b TaxID=2705012 RepID=UPI0015FBBE4A|nr:acyl carrier protein [Streptacidiphilus sp. PB12-B1b]QMU78302.1 acyl carrier protein [Streptacidiphilus sp. PB12-B1b]